MTGLLTVLAISLAAPTAEAAPALPGTVAAGVSLERLRPRLRRYLGVPAGLLVVETTAGSPAEQAGLQAGDVLVQANEGRVFASGQVSLLVSLHRGETLSLLVYREGKLFSAGLQVPARHRSGAQGSREGAIEQRSPGAGGSASSGAADPQGGDGLREEGPTRGS